MGDSTHPTKGRLLSGRPSYLRRETARQGWPASYLQCRWGTEGTGVLAIGHFHGLESETKSVILCRRNLVSGPIPSFGTENDNVKTTDALGDSPITSSQTSQIRAIAIPSLLIAFVLAVAIPATHAGTIYATGFENPPFTLGNLVGQDGWQEFGTTSVDVQTSVVYAGSQAVWVDGSASSQSGPYHSDFSTGPLVGLSAYIYLASSSTQSSWQFAGLGSGLFPFIGGIDTDPSNNNILLITAGLPVVGTITRGAWHNVYFVFNFTTQKYNFWLDGTQLGSNVPFCGDNGPCLGEHVASYGTGFFDTFGGGNDSGYLDNYSVSNVPSVPEPGSIALLGSGIVGLAGVLRRRMNQ